jgi:hypothetical protein
MDCDTKSSIDKLRELRDYLCKKQSNWEHVFKVKDAIVDQLRQLKSFANDPKSKKEDIVQKIDSILTLIDSDRKEDLENCNG